MEMLLTLNWRVTKRRQIEVTQVHWRWQQDRVQLTELLTKLRLLMNKLHLAEQHALHIYPLFG